MRDTVFIVTGGGGALAGSVGRAFRAAGARLVLVDSRSQPLEQRALELDAHPVVADLGRFSEGARVVEETLREMGRLDGLVHTVGSFAMAAATENSEALFEQLVGANLKTTVAMVQACLPVLVPQRRGFIAAISSQVVWEGQGAAGMSLYAAAKAALSMYLRSVAREVRSEGVRVTIVYPLAAIDTPANRAAMPTAAPNTWVDPEEIAQALLFAARRSDRGVLFELPVGVVLGTGGEEGA